MNRAAFRCRARPQAAACLVSLLVVSWGCASSPGADFSQQQAAAEAKVVTSGLGQDPRVGTALSELEAAVARENDLVLLDTVELRAAAVSEKDKTAL